MKTEDKSPLCTLDEIAETIGVGRTTLQHHSTWDRKNFPKPKLITGNAKYYDEAKVIGWYAKRQEKHRVQVLAEQKRRMPINSAEDLIAFRIFETRTNLKLTRKKLSEMIGVNESAIAHWETFSNIKTRTQPRPENFIKLAEVTGADLNYLMAKDKLELLTMDYLSTPACPQGLTEYACELEGVDLVCHLEYIPEELGSLDGDGLPSEPDYSETMELVSAYIKGTDIDIGHLLLQGLVDHITTTALEDYKNDDL
jgi:transcriptional regulator with XRE-family HTH domain/predicted DNA-binding transcriptional regulator AlpA